MLELARRDPKNPKSENSAILHDDLDFKDETIQTTAFLKELTLRLSRLHDAAFEHSLKVNEKARSKANASYARKPLHGGSRLAPQPPQQLQQPSLMRLPQPANNTPFTQHNSPACRPTSTNRPTPRRTPPNWQPADGLAVSETQQPLATTLTPPGPPSVAPEAGPGATTTVTPPAPESETDPDGSTAQLTTLALVAGSPWRNRGCN
jgi:hypothetical protein